MNYLQKCQLEILDILTQTLDKNGFTYWLAYGTVIGAVRHKGFIPWDDDIDICMPIDEYDRFAEIANDILPQGYFYQDKNTDKEYPYTFAKIRKDNTLFVQKPVAKYNMHHGVYVDIFPMIGVPDEKIKQKILLKKLLYLGKIAIAPTFQYSETTQKGKKKYMAKVLMILHSFIGEKILNKEIMKLSHKYDCKKSHSWIEPLGGETYVINKNVFNDEKGFTMMIFEDKEYKCPERTDEYLKKIYGDYMQLPQEDKRISHHQLVEIKL